MFLSSIDNRSHAFLNRNILDAEASYSGIGETAFLQFPVNQIVVPFVLLRHIRAGDHVGVDSTSGAHLCNFVLCERSNRMPADAVDPAMLVVHRDPGMTAKRAVPVRRNHRVEGHQPMGRPPIIMALAGVSSCGDQQAVIGFRNVELRRRIGSNQFPALPATSEDAIFGLLRDQHGVTMQAGNVAGIDAAFQRL